MLAALLAPARAYVLLFGATVGADEDGRAQGEPRPEGGVDDEVVGVGLSEALGVVVWVADADGLAFAVVRVGVGVADGVFAGDFSAAFGVLAVGVAAGLDAGL